MPTAQDVADYIVSVAPLELGISGDSTGFMYGDESTQVERLVVCWSPTIEVIRRAASLRAQMIVAHEPLFFSAAHANLEGETDRWFEEVSTERKPPNLLRKAALDRARIVVYRCHSNWDAAPGVGVVDAFANLMDFRVEAHHGRFARVYEIVPVTLGELATRVRDRLSVEHCRVAGDLDRRVSRPGVMVGGLGQMFTAAEEVGAHGADVVIFGEALDHTFRYALELGLAVIETEHGAMENVGLRELARVLSERFPEVRVQFLDTGPPGRVL
jgi:putative NIF3 family GTP cyclohydrolase 1 type 2